MDKAYAYFKVYSVSDDRSIWCQQYKLNNANEEFHAVLTEIKSLIAKEVTAKNICLVARTYKLLDNYIDLFISNGIRCYGIKGNKADVGGLDGICVATIHRVKELEFQYVFVIVANKRIIPIASAIMWSVGKKLQRLRNACCMSL